MKSGANPSEGKYVTLQSDRNSRYRAFASAHKSSDTPGSLKGRSQRPPSSRRFDGVPGSIGMRALQSCVSSPLVQLQIHRGLDERQMRQRLRKVAEKSRGLGIDLFGMELVVKVVSRIAVTGKYARDTSYSVSGRILRKPSRRRSGRGNTNPCCRRGR